MLGAESKYFQEYYDFVLEGKDPSSKTKKAIFSIINDISDRRGLKHEWGNIDGDIQDEIIDKWIEIISE